MVLFKKKNVQPSRTIQCSILIPVLHGRNW